MLFIFLFILSWFLLCALKLKFSLHMIQLVGYKNDKYLDWIGEHINKVHTKKDKAYTVVSVVLLLIFMVYPGISGIDTAFLLLTVIFLCAGYFTKNDYKKPLSFTGRAKRLYAMSLAILLADFAITLFIVFSVSKDLIKYFPVWAGILSVMYYFSPLYVYLANYLVQPIEKDINDKFYNHARNKIRSLSKLVTVGITGSYGKTSTKFITSSILKQKYSVLNTPESYNTPMGISKVINNDLSDKYEVFIAELGATQTGDIEEVSVLTNPKIGIITSIGPCHLDSFKSIENIMRTKYELIESLPNNGIAIFNYDNEYVKKLADKTFKEKILYGIDDIENTDVFATDIKVSSTGCTFTLCIAGLGTEEVSTKLLGKHNILNILAGCAAAKALGLTLEEIKKGIACIEPVKHRLELMDPGTGVTVIDDAFNSNPDGAKAALDVLNDFKDKRKIIVTPGMVELGEIEETENEKFGESIGRVCDMAILVGEKRTEPILRGLRKLKFNENNIFTVNSLEEATEVLKSVTRVNDVVLFENDLPDTYDEK